MSKLKIKDILDFIIKVLFIGLMLIGLIYSLLNINKLKVVKADSYDNYTYNSSTETITLDTLILKSNTTFNDFHVYTLDLEPTTSTSFSLDFYDYEEVIFPSNYKLYMVCNLARIDSVDSPSPSLLEIDSLYSIDCDLSEDDCVYIYSSQGEVGSCLPDHIYFLSSFAFGDLLQDYPRIETSTLDSLCTVYSTLFFRTIDISDTIDLVGTIAYNSGYSVGYDAGLIDVDNANSSLFSWTSVFNAFFTMTIFPNFKIYYLLVFALGCIVFRTISKALFH